MRRAGSVVAAVVLLGMTSATPVRAGLWEDAGWGALSAISNLGYMPAKLVYASVGAFAGGLAYVCTAGDYETADSIWTAALGGTYVITPEVLRGERQLAFAGMPGEPVTPPVGAAAASDPPPISLSEQSLGS